MQKHPLLSVKQAAEMLRLDERSVRERLINGQLKGEKRSVGLREKWFVFSGSVEAALSKQHESFTGDPIGLTEVSVESEFVDAAAQESISDERNQDLDDDSWLDLNRDRVQTLASEFLKPLADKIEAQAEIIFEQRRTISDQERQIRLLPDLQKQAEEERKVATLKAFEAEALRKQIVALQEERDAANAARAEMEDLKAQKEAQVTAVQNQLKVLAETVNELKTPWWKKMFGTGGDVNKT